MSANLCSLPSCRLPPSSILYHMWAMQSHYKPEVTRTRHDVILMHAANGAISTGAMSQPPPPPHHAPKQDQEDNASGLSRGNSSASSHAPNGVGLPAESTNGYMPMLYSAGPGAQQQPNLTSSYTPLPDKVRGPLCGGQAFGEEIAACAYTVSCG